MKVLVAYSSKHGATAGIAERIGERFTARGFNADVIDIRKNPDPVEYDAIVLGSAVYIGSWQKQAVAFVHAHVPQLRVRPVWLFSSGPLAEPSLDEPKTLAELRGLIAPRGHKVFPGALKKDALSLPERVVIAAVSSQMKKDLEGDFREWEEIDAWADSIVRELVWTPAGVG